MRRALAAAAVAALVLTGCAESEEPAASPGPTVSASQDAGDAGDAGDSEAAEDSGAEPIEVEIEGDRIDPRGMRVQVTAGETVTLDVTSDRAAELHVHSSPAQVLEVEPGESALELVIDRPGIVDIEEHETGLVVLQLEVR